MRFVVLEHFRGPLDRPDHFDLMFSLPNGELRTWSIRRRPDMANRLEAASLPDHRAAYLVYQGPTKRGGGWVRRWTRGSFRPLLQRDECWRVVVESSRLTGIVSFEQDGAGSWRYTFFRRLPAEPDR